jgi:cell wall-associated NlpC family hydrolase
MIPESTHCVSVLRTFIYSEPELKAPVSGWLSLASVIPINGEAENGGTRFLLLAEGEGAVAAAHLVPLDDDSADEGDLVSVAERFVETPYLWGGRTSLGLDCSALLQLSLMRYGLGWHRDTDLQERTLGLPVEGGLVAELDRGDLVFWEGHVGILVDRAHMVHASGYHMRVVVEPLEDAIARMGPPMSIRRFNDRGRIGARAAGVELRVPGA